MANPQVIVEFIAKVDDLRKGFKETEASAQSTGDKLKSFGKVALVAAGAAGLAALTYTLHTGVQEFEDHAKAAAQTAAVLKSTGGAAHVTASHVEDLAGKLLQVSGVDDEVIQGGENILLTFRSIRNEVGKGNDIFDQATKATLDLSVALGKDMQSSAILVGKALNDPVRGLSALRRVGVQFTKAQEDMIKNMVKSGNTIGAQKLILAELNKEFGGSAQAAGKTLPGQLNILKQNFNNLAGEIVGTLAPALGAVAKFFAANPALAKAVVIGILALSAAVVALNVALAVTAVVTSPITLTILAIAAAVAALTVGIILLVTHFNEIVDWIKAHWDIAALIVAPFALIPIEIAKHWDEIVGVVTGIFTGALNAIKNVGNDIISTVSNIFGANGIGGAISDAFNSLFNQTYSLGKGIAKGLADGVVGLGSTIGKQIGGIGTTVGHAFQQIWQWGANIGKWLLQGLDSAVQWAASHAWGAINNIGGQIWKVFDQIYGWGKTVGTWIVNGVVGGLGGIAGAVWNAIGSIGGFLWKKLDEVFNWGWDLGRSIWNGLVAAFKGIGNAIINAIKSPINAVISAWNSLKIGSFTIPMPGPIPDIHFGGIGLPNIPYLAQGGMVMGPTLAMLGEAGPEMVVPLNGAGNAPVQVRVYIGDQELTGMIRTEVVTQNNRTAQTLLAGLT